jgi:vancomycin permeability regulator SanA
MEVSPGKYVALGVGAVTFALATLAPLSVDPLGVWVARPHRLDFELARVTFRGLEIVTAALLLAFGLGRLGRAGRKLLALLAGGAALLALADTAAFYDALVGGTVASIAIVPASLFAALVLAGLALAALRDDGAPVTWTRRSAALAGASVIVVTTLVPLGELVTFGVSRYERHAPVAVVFGARAYADGTPSQALADRVDEAARLYKKGLVTRLFLSGGIDPEVGVSEPEVMRARAVAAGVPEEAIEIDEHGDDTQKTVENAAASMRAHGDRSALVVTHWFHEPRAKILFDAAGVRAFIVPARMRRRLLAEPYYVAREVAAHYVALARAPRPSQRRSREGGGASSAISTEPRPSLKV